MVSDNGPMKTSKNSMHFDKMTAVLAQYRPRLGKMHHVAFKNVFGAMAAYVDGQIFMSSGKFGLALKLPSPLVKHLLRESRIPSKIF